LGLLGGQRLGEPTARIGAIVAGCGSDPHAAADLLCLWWRRGCIMRAKAATIAAINDYRQGAGSGRLDGVRTLGAGHILFGSGSGGTGN
jgi:hypothetical protein